MKHGSKHNNLLEQLMEDIWLLIPQRVLITECMMKNPTTGKHGKTIKQVMKHPIISRTCMESMESNGKT